MIDAQTHNAILYFGYDPACNQSGLSDVITNSVQAEPVTQDRKEAVQLGQEALIGAIQTELDKLPDGSNHIVPLSSGLDSRAILGTLVHHTPVEKDNISTLTFGMEGLWDFDIGQEVAAFLNIDNHTIKLDKTSVDWSENSIRDFVRRSSNTPTRVFESYVNQEVQKFLNSNAVIWTGYLGDPSAGAHLPSTFASDWDTACEYFVQENRFTTNFEDLSFEPLKRLPDNGYCGSALLSFEDQLDFAHRQPCFVSPIVLGHTGTYANPFTTKKWLSFMLNVPVEFRQQRNLFIKILLDLYPDLASLPSDNTLGLPLTANKWRLSARRFRLKLHRKIGPKLDPSYIYPGKNYLDFDRKFREPGELRETAKSLLESYDERELKRVDAMEIWEQHQSGLDRNKEIRAICAVELYLSEGVQESR